MTTTRAMSRREFTLAAGLVVAVAAAEVSRADTAPHFAFYDPRFPQAIAHGLRLGTPIPWRPIDSDAAAIWRRQLRLALSRLGELRAVGITTPSVPFCLEVLAREHAAVRLTQQRIDRDLVHWILEAKAHG